ncbi:translocation and assembly module lipoprotein TamL [Echinicola shivajiensis]|uniref:translocation and assembly module lipoprotein TamL n=1 Tax=Echinicola shivajiensis TaxID=1035916 RepID=UPI001BFCA9DE|nr:BamA/TamA family outer membrane protein [Echinicola shivajiensis]
MKQRLSHIVLVLLLLTACSRTKSLSEGEVLYTGSRIKIIKKEYKEDWKVKDDEKKLVKVYWDLWDLPNGAFFGLPTITFIPTRLWAYNFFYNEKQKGVAKWMRDNFGEEPVTISKVNPELKTQKAIEDYENFGHFGTMGTYDLRYNKKHNKAYVTYKITIPKAYTYRNVSYVKDTLELELLRTFLKYQPKSVLSVGEEFDLDKIKKEKIGLRSYLQDNGYYFLGREDIKIMADTTVGYKQIDVRVSIDENLPKSHYQKQRMGDVTIQIDTAMSSDDRFYYWSNGKIKKSLIKGIVQLEEGQNFSAKKTQHAVRDLASLGVFNNPTITYEVLDKDSLTLGTKVSMQPMDASLFGFSLKGNYKTTGYIGPAVNVNFNQLNLFGGAENLSLEADAYYDFPIGLYKERVSRSSGFHISSSIDAPLLHPLFKFVKRYDLLPRQFVTLDFEYNNRRDYFTLAGWNASYGYTWKSSPKINHKLELLKVTYSDIIRSSERFDTLVNNDPALRSSLINQFILGSAYTFRYDNSSTVDKRVGTYFEGNVELAGNVLNLINSTYSIRENGNRKFLGVKYSQFARFRYDFRTYLRLGAYSHLVFRNIAGIGLSYGNSDQMPYIKEFFIGGTNSLRPFNARTIGPGRYIELDEAEVNQVGDFKLEWNLEYRFKIFTKLNGAVWSDAGNIWLLEEDPNRPFSGINWDNVFQESYLTSGIGLRIDLKFLLLRADYGAVLYAPIFIDGYKWLWQNKLPLHGPVIGFGYPF